MKKYIITVIIDYHQQDVSASFTINSENKVCAKTAVMSMLNEFYTRDGDAYVDDIQEVCP